jgi:hypothetical protein
MTHYKFYCEQCKKEVALTLSIGTFSHRARVSDGGFS